MGYYIATENIILKDNISIVYKDVLKVELINKIYIHIRNLRGDNLYCFGKRKINKNFRYAETWEEVETIVDSLK